jgi:hypothetical protein
MIKARDSELSSTRDHGDHWGASTTIGIMVNMGRPDPNPASLSPQEREARLNAVFADVRPSHNTAEGVLIVGGREAQLLWYATVDAYIVGNWVATILCGQATCERVLAGLVSLNELPGAGIVGPKGWERWGLGNSSSTSSGGSLTTCWTRSRRCARSASPSVTGVNRLVRVRRGAASRSSSARSRSSILVSWWNAWPPPIRMSWWNA